MSAAWSRRRRRVTQAVHSLDAPCPCRSVNGPCPQWSEFVSYTHGYARFTALNASALAFEYVNTTDGSIVDRVLILQDLSGW